MKPALTLESFESEKDKKPQLLGSTVYTIKVVTVGKAFTAHQTLTDLRNS